jgi:predicted DNA-binding transcriptional regulator YafY
MSELKKKPSLLYVLQILQKYSHEKNPLTQNKIAEYLLDEYDIELERKAIGRCIDTLEAAGYDIVRDAKGVYLGTASALEDAQLQIIIDSVISNRAITATDSKKLVDQLLSMGTAGLKLRNPHINTLNTWGKPEKSVVPYNIDAIQKALDERHQISFLYDNKVMCPNGERMEASPVECFVREGYYYLVAVLAGHRSNRLVNFPLNKVTDVQILEKKAILVTTIPGYEKGFDMRNYLAAHPDMLERHHCAKRVKFAFCESSRDILTKAFGNDIWVQPSSGSLGLMTAVVDADLEEAVRLALRYPTDIFLLYPEDAKNQVIQRWNNGLKVYERLENEQKGL